MEDSPCIVLNCFFSSAAVDVDEPEPLVELVEPALVVLDDVGSPSGGIVLDELGELCLFELLVVGERLPVLDELGELPPPPSPRVFVRRVWLGRKRMLFSDRCLLLRAVFSRRVSLGREERRRLLPDDELLRLSVVRVRRGRRRFCSGNELLLSRSASPPVLLRFRVLGVAAPRGPKLLALLRRFSFPAEGGRTPARARVI